jgi:hypothetical protein
MEVPEGINNTKVHSGIKRRINSDFLPFCPP